MHLRRRRPKPTSLFRAHRNRRFFTRDPAALRVVELVARACGIPVELVLNRARAADVARARQLAVYLIHVMLQRPFKDTAQLVGRDRTTVAYACARIEDEREDPAFDAEVSRLEAMIEEQMIEIRRAS
jgi:chromosomal replication initiation ATPase DnaA